jgi:hypothetical protein
MIEHPSRPGFPLGESALALIWLGIALFMIGAFLPGRHAWAFLIALLLSGIGAGAAMLIRSAERCELCDAEVSRRERYTRKSLCWYCRIYTPPDTALPPLEKANDGRDRASRQYRLAALRAVRDPRTLTIKELRCLAEQRQTWQLADEGTQWLFREVVTERGDSERWRIFRTYAAQLLLQEDFEPADFELLLKVMEAMTGIAPSEFYTLPDLQRLNVRAQLRGFKAGWVCEPADAPSEVWLDHGEQLLWCEAVQWMDRPAQTLTTQEELGATMKFFPGADISAKATIERSIELPPGPLQVTGDVMLTVTTNEVKLVGDYTGPHFVEYDQLVGVWEEKRQSSICVINSRESDRPIVLQGRNGALIVAAVRFGYTLHRRKD